MKEKKHVKPSAPRQLVIGGQLGKTVWENNIVPLLRREDLSTRDLAVILGVGHMTISRWRAYL